MATENLELLVPTGVPTLELTAWRAVAPNHYVLILCWARQCGTFCATAGADGSDLHTRMAAGLRGLGCAVGDADSVSFMCERFGSEATAWLKQELVMSELEREACVR